jgi:ZIP family zinc transporter
MSLTPIAALGAIAGVTIFIGLPIGRLRHAMPRTRALVNAVATGILIFLIWDVLSHAWAPVDAALGAHQLGVAGGDGLVFAVGIMGLVYFDRWVTRLATMIAVGIGLHNFGEGLAIGNSVASGALQLAVLLVIGFALHNATEGFGIVAPLAA